MVHYSIAGPRASKAAHIRLLYLRRLSQADHNLAVVAADRMDILESATKQIRGDPNWPAATAKSSARGFRRTPPFAREIVA